MEKKTCCSIKDIKKAKVKPLKPIFNLKKVKKK